MKFSFGPLQLKPRISCTSYTSSHSNKGKEYHNRFDKLPGRNLVWELEQEVLHGFAKANGMFKAHLDFAGGTGRIAKILESYTSSQYILDVSEKMLSMAKKELKNATILNCDFRKCGTQLNNHSIDLVTAFRFFSNAEPELRKSAMEFISLKIKRGGVLICNNHRNFWSLPYFSMRMLFCGGEFGMKNITIKKIARDCGFEFVRSYSMGIIPQTESKAIMSWKMVNYIEKTIFRWLSDKHRLGYNVIFIFKRL